MVSLNIGTLEGVEKQMQLSLKLK